MTDSRLETLLAQGPPGGDDATGLATRARGRQRARRRTTGLTVAAVALAVAAVPVTAAVVDDDQGLSILRPEPQVLQTEPAVDPRTRTETWHRLSLEVPADWDHHGGADWCVATREPGFGVDRPEGVTAAIGCTPGQAYGVTFGDGSAIRWVYESGHVWQYRWESESESESESEDQVKVYPEDSWLGLVQDGDDYALVVTRSEALTRRIVESADVVDGVDANGCAVRNGEDSAQGSGDRWSVCRYDAADRLVQSELLTVAQTEAFSKAVQSAPPFAVIGGCRARAEPSGRVVAGSGGDLGSVSIVFEDTCFQRNGVFLSGTSGALTRDILYWALSPGWSGSVGAGVPLPDQLRK